MKVLIYKRTHKGDPDKEGIFGINDCMGRSRNWNYDAVIGIGGNPWKGQPAIKHKINWIGLGSKKIVSSKRRGDIVVFAYFELYDEKGINIKENYPNLFEYMYINKRRFKIFDMSSDLPENMFEEIREILDLIKGSRPSKTYDAENDDILETNVSSKSSKCSRGQERGAVCKNNILHKFFSIIFYK